MSTSTQSTVAGSSSAQTQANAMSAATPEGTKSPADVPPVGPHYCPGPEPKANSWETSLEYAQKHVDSESKPWNDEVANLLIFASLFSAVVGAFAVESYHNVQQDPADTTVLLLQSLLALQINATNPRDIDLDPQTPITASARRINIYNFLSLILSLSVVMAGILCLQWLREYGQDPSGVPGPRRDHLGIRYMRREGMKHWHVYKILRSLPLILLLSLLLFFAGIIELLLPIDEAATIVASIAIGITAAFMLLTTVLPAFQAFILKPVFPKLTQCPYKSPQSFIFYQATALIATIIGLSSNALSNAFYKVTKRSRPDPKGERDSSYLRTWSTYDWFIYSGHVMTDGTGAVSNVGFGLHWLGRMYLQEKKFMEALWECLQNRGIHETLRAVLTFNKDDRRAASTSRAFSPPTTDDVSDDKQAYNDDHVAEVTIYQTLAHLAHKLEKGHHATVLVKRRLQMFIKINQYRLDEDIDYPMIDPMDQRELLTDETRLLILRIIIQLMQEKRNINETHLSAIDTILAMEADLPNPDLGLFERTNKALQEWIDQKAEVRRQNQRQNQNEDQAEAQDEQDREGETPVETEAIRVQNRVDVLRRLALTKQSTM
ncbi:hypothetical protein NP233_g416 [Leucocoprinus birnbaumii]|uniref:DUF6535 domain-containing protein n=1 Tax=Leucocoprinus birnbaumii TaxID=56174 RepID=A0AAD5W5J0_9AGAR|nr:hypothetical protein NP233_g416 [Leucocoprinus birnbaumii]